MQGQEVLTPLSAEHGRHVEHQAWDNLRGVASKLGNTEVCHMVCHVRRQLAQADLSSESILPSRHCLRLEIGTQLSLQVANLGLANASSGEQTAKKHEKGCLHTVDSRRIHSVHAWPAAVAQDLRKTQEEESQAHVLPTTRLFQMGFSGLC